MPDPDNIPDLLDRLARALHDALGVTARSVDVHVLESDRPVSLPVLPRYGARPAEGPPAERLNPTERRILKAVAALDKDEPTIGDVAAAVKDKSGPHLKKLLALMRDDGLLGGGRDDAGYPITAAGLAALTGEGEP